MRHTMDPDNPIQRGEGSRGVELANDLERFCVLYGGQNIAAVIVEPVAGSTGVLVPPKGYLQRLREICDRYGILLVLDEVLCGFGRLGTTFGADKYAVVPDIMTIAKAMTNGTVPMGGVVVADHIYAAIIDGAPDEAIELFHGYTYSAHPLACAAGSATLGLFKDERIFERTTEQSDSNMEMVFDALADVKQVSGLRGTGYLYGVDLVSEQSGPVGPEASKRLWDAGVYLKFTGDTAIIAPPLVCEPEDFQSLCQTVRDVVSTL